MEIIYYTVIKSDAENINILGVNYKTRLFRRHRCRCRCDEECGWIIVVKIERIVIWKWRNNKK